MSENPTTDESGRIYRVDKFIVPIRARKEFIDGVRTTHELLRTLPGFVQDFILEQSAGPGMFNFVTLAEWEDAASIEAARTAVRTMHEKMSFSPRDVMTQLGIEADLGNYRRIETTNNRDKSSH